MVEALVVELSALYGLSDKRKEQNGTGHFLQGSGFDLFEMLLFNSRFVGYVFLSFPLRLNLMNYVSKAEPKHMNGF